MLTEFDLTNYVIGKTENITDKKETNLALDPEW